MSRATIVHELGEGAYVVDVAYERGSADARYAQLTASAAAIRANELPALQAAAATAAAAVTAAAAALAGAMVDYQAAQAGGDPAAIAAALAALQAAADPAATADAALIRASGAVHAAELRAVSLERQAATLSAYLGTASRRYSVWCADHTLELTGDVGCLEVGRVGSSGPIIQPGGAGGTGSRYTPSRDGGLTQTMSMIPEAAFHSLALLPGVERWRPGYRLGTLTAVDTALDTVALDLDAATSPGPGRLDINAATSLSDVPADYMGTGADLYTVGDRVVVGFSDDLVADPDRANGWARPYVVGFVSNPRVTGEIVAVYLHDGFSWSPPGVGPWTVEFYLGETPYGGYAPGHPYIDLGGYESPAGSYYSFGNSYDYTSWAYYLFSARNDGMLSVAATVGDTYHLPEFVSSAGTLAVSWPLVPEIDPQVVWPDRRVMTLQKTLLKTIASDAVEGLHTVYTRFAVANVAGTGTTVSDTSAYPPTTHAIISDAPQIGYWRGYTGQPMDTYYQGGGPAADGLYYLRTEDLEWV